MESNTDQSSLQTTTMELEKKDLYLLVRQFDASIAHLAGALREADPNEYIYDSVIKRFEQVYDLSWLSLKMAFSFIEIEVENSEEAFKAALENEWIDNEPLWHSMIRVRQKTQAPYSLDRAEEFHGEIIFFHDAFVVLAGALKSFCVELERRS